MSNRRTLTQAELLAEAKALFGDDPRTFAFRCPNCYDVATVEDFLIAGAGGERVGQECIGRSLGALNRSEPYAGRGCDWAAYGLLPGPWAVVLPAEGNRPERTVWSFALAAPS